MVMWRDGGINLYANIRQLAGEAEQCANEGNLSLAKERIEKAMAEGEQLLYAIKGVERGRANREIFGTAYKNREKRDRK